MDKQSGFYERVYELCKKVPEGKVTTYKILAERLGTKDYRAVGAAMNKNPYGILNCSGKNMVPCHRVVSNSGHLHGFAHGLRKKTELLEKEGIKVVKDKIIDFERILFRF